MRRTEENEVRRRGSAHWDDEGKGKVVDYLSGAFDYIARVAGGHNAGHTIIIGRDRFVLQLIPCGILRPKQHAVIGTGVVVDPAALVAEIETLSKAGVNVSGQLRAYRRLLELPATKGNRTRIYNSLQGKRSIFQAFANE